MYQPDWDAASEQPLGTFGLEVCVSFCSIGGLISIRADNDFWRRKCRDLFVRPAVEPLLLAEWHKLESFEMTEPQLASLCSMLCGSKQEARARNSYGLWEGGDVRFEPPERARHWWDDIRAVVHTPELAPLLPAYAFARTIIAHPYPDGNGRLARALVHASLARTGGLNAPVLPLAPAFYMNGTKVAAALRELSSGGDWNQFNRTFHQVLETAVELSRAVRSIAV
jgi:hypothetical protein